MTDIRERLSVFDRIEMPELWTEAERREPHQPMDRGPSPGRRAVIALLALAIAAAGFAFAVRAFHREVRPSGLSTRGEIALIDVVDGQRDVFIVNPDGTGLHRLTDTSEAEYGLSWSPDGTHLVTAQEPGNGAHPPFELVSIDVATGAEHVILRCDDPSRRCPNIGSPEWSPDGRQIAMSSDFGTYVINADGTGLRQLTSDGPTTYQGKPARKYDGAPAWSPDGTKIAFARDFAVTVEGGQNSTSEIYVMNSDGTAVHALTQLGDVTRGISGAGSPRWSPGGSTIAFLSESAVGPKTLGGPQIVDVMSADGSDVHTLVSCRQLPSPCVSLDSVTWSSDGRQLAFDTEGPPTNSSLMGPGKLFIVNADGTDATAILDLGSGGDASAAWQPVVSLATAPSPQPSTPARSGSSVSNGSIWALGGGGEAGSLIYAVDPLTGTKTPLWSDGRSPDFPNFPVAPDLVAAHYDYAFSPDGSRVAFAGYVNRGSADCCRIELFVMDADGEPPHTAHAR